MNSEPTAPSRRKVGLLGWLAGTDTTGQLDERERTVMVESYAVGFVVHLYLCCALAAVAIWVWGSPVKWVTWWLLVLPIISLAAIVRWNAIQGGVSPYSNRCMSRHDRLVRAAPALVLALVWAAGMLRTSAGPFDAATLAGMVTGGLVGLAAVVVVVVVVRWFGNRRRADQTQQAAWDDDEVD